jgi:hypothetical protein
MGPVVANLRVEIGKLRKMSIEGGRYIVSQHELKCLFPKEVVGLAIQECGVPDFRQPHAANRIFNEGRVVLGILIWKGWEQKLTNFIAHNSLDDQLPLDIEQAQKVSAYIGQEFSRNAQWEFLPRILTKEMSGYNCQIRDEEILPYIGKPEFLGKGAFGEVFKLSVLPSCQTIFPQQVCC